MGRQPICDPCWAISFCLGHWTNRSLAQQTMAIGYKRIKKHHERTTHFDLAERGTHPSIVAVITQRTTTKHRKKRHRTLRKSGYRKSDAREIEFVRVALQQEDMNKANVSSAKTILIDNPHDDITMTTALFCSKHNPNAHIVAYFNDESLVGLLQQHCPNVECTPSVAVEMLAKSAFDPGSSLLHHDLLSVADGHEQYSIIVPQEIASIQVADIFVQIKHIHDAIFIGFAKADDKQHIIVNPSFDTHIFSGDRVFYIARSRINDMQWHDFLKG